MKKGEEYFNVTAGLEQTYLGDIYKNIEVLSIPSKMVYKF